MTEAKSQNVWFCNLNRQDDAAAAFGFAGTTVDPCEETSGSSTGGGSSTGAKTSGRKKRQAPTAAQKTQLAENLLRVDVYFETLSIQNITETPTYNVRSNMVGIKQIITHTLKLIDKQTFIDWNLYNLFILGIFTSVIVRWSSFFIPWISYVYASRDLWTSCWYLHQFVWVLCEEKINYENRRISSY